MVFVIDEFVVYHWLYIVWKVVIFLLCC